MDKDFSVYEYILNCEKVTSPLFGSMDPKSRYQGHVTLGVSRRIAERYPSTQHCLFGTILPGNEEALWYRNLPAYTVTFKERTSAGNIRQPRIKEARRN